MYRYEKKMVEHFLVESSNFWREGQELKRKVSPRWMMIVILPGDKSFVSTILKYISVTERLNKQVK
jgi:hypothetical protein